MAHSHKWLGPLSLLINSRQVSLSRREGWQLNFVIHLAKSGIEPKLTDHETIVPPLHYFAYILIFFFLYIITSNQI